MQIKVHPAADLFPMMTPEELQELAADIQASGLRNPIMLSHDGKQLIDGRNRLAACELGKVEPTFAKLAADDDPLAYIASVNLMRRNLTKGQQAMAMAMMYPVEKGGRGKLSQKRESLDRTMENRVSQARAILRHSRSLAESVLKGITPLNDALATMKQQEQYQQSDEAKLTRLQQSAPDLAEMVSEERLTINGALAELGERNATVERLREGGRNAVKDVPQFRTTVACIAQAMYAGEKHLVTAEMVEQAFEAANLLQKLLKEEMNNGDGDR
jgi:hypothetical protein